MMTRAEARRRVDIILESWAKIASNPETVRVLLLNLLHDLNVEGGWEDNLTHSEAATTDKDKATLFELEHGLISLIMVIMRDYGLTRYQAKALLKLLAKAGRVFGGTQVAER